MFCGWAGPFGGCRTSALYHQQASEITALCASKASKAKIAEKSKQTGINLDHSGRAVMANALANIPRISEQPMDGISVEVAHDGLLGNWPQQVYLNLFFYTRDPKNPNYFGLDKLQDRYDEYPFKNVSRYTGVIATQCLSSLRGLLRGDIPPQFKFFNGRSAKVGRQLYGSDFLRGSPVPLQAEHFKWTAAMSFTFLIHAVAFLHPLITDHQEAMWVNLKQHQEYLLGLLQWQARVKDILALDVKIREHQLGWRAIWQFKPLYKFKLHVILHACHNWLMTAPPRAHWCLKGNGLATMQRVCSTQCEFACAR